MATGITLRFLRDAADEPRVLLIRDRLAACPVCGLERVERIYGDTSYHHLTAARFRQLASTSAEGFSQVCEQCGEALSASDVVRWTLTYGFPQESGLIQAFGSRDDDRPMRYVISPHRDLDAQAHPEWEVPDDQSVAVAATLTDERVHALTGRYLSLKAGWRQLLRAGLERRSQAVATVALAGGCQALVGPAAGVEAALAERDLTLAEPDSPPTRWVVTSLADPINRLVPHGPEEWLPAAWLEALERGDLWALALGDIQWAAVRLREMLKSLPVRARCRVQDGWEVEATFPLGDDREPARRHLSLANLVLEALVTGSAPSDRLGLWLDDQLVDITAVDA